MTIKLFSYIILCAFIFSPAVIVNSQPHNAEKEKVLYAEKVKLLHEKEVENRNLKVKIKANEQEINELLGQLIEKKAVKKPIYKRIFVHRDKKKVLPGIITDPVPVKIDTGTVSINPVDTVSVIVPSVPKREAFFKRLFNKVFKHKNK